MDRVPGLDLAARRWWRAVGRETDTDGAEAWLHAPMSDGSVVAHGWVRLVWSADPGRGHFRRRSPADPRGGSPRVAAVAAPEMALPAGDLQPGPGRE